MLFLRNRERRKVKCNVMSEIYETEILKMKILKTAQVILNK